MKDVLTGHPSPRLSGCTVLDMNPSYDFAGQVAPIQIDPPAWLLEELDTTPRNKEPSAVPERSA